MHFNSNISSSFILKPLINDIGDATLIVPLLKEYLELGIKNDEQLIKMATIIQRVLSRSEEEAGLGISDEEKDQLLAEMAKLIQDNYQRVIVSTVSPTELIRDQALEILKGKVLVVYVHCSLEIAEVRDVKDMNARFCVVDGKEIVFMLMDDNEVHPTYDVGIWVKTEFFAETINSFFDTEWKKMKSFE